MFLFTRTKHPAAKVVIAQGNNLGDCIMCMPMAGILKEYWPQTQITFVSPRKLQPVIEASPHIDGFLSSEDVLEDSARLAGLQADIFLNPFTHLGLAKAAMQARIPFRVGNMRRVKLVRYCNQFVFYGRRRSGLHEAILHLKDLGALGIPRARAPQDLHRYMALTRAKPLSQDLATHIDPKRFNLILHTRSNGNGREWPLQHYAALAAALPSQDYQIFLTGLQADREALQQQCPQLLDTPQIVDLMGKLSMEELVSFVNAADGLVAASTGPLHLAAALGKHALGIYPPRKPLDIQRWGPIGPLAESMSLPGLCTPRSGGCPYNTHGRPCECMNKISPQQVMERVVSWTKP